MYKLQLIYLSINVSSVNCGINSQMTGQCIIPYMWNSVHTEPCPITCFFCILTFLLEIAFNLSYIMGHTCRCYRTVCSCTSEKLSPLELYVQCLLRNQQEWEQTCPQIPEMQSGARLVQQQQDQQPRLLERPNQELIFDLEPMIKRKRMLTNPC